jgi:cobalt/nickel transport protein
MNKRELRFNNWLLLLGVIVITVVPLVLVRGAKYSGSDDQAEKAIGQIQPEYKRWFKPIIELPSQEIATLLFSVQAATGAGVIGYVIGLYKGRSQKDEHSD